MGILSLLRNALGRSRKDRDASEAGSGTGTENTTAVPPARTCLLYPSDAADAQAGGELGGGRIIQSQIEHGTHAALYAASV
ncbi:hypothetical protein CLM82_09670 [Streptomyces albidoflavus]|nr:hypothetical protein CLM82_09670 [Streptomyces albidoflavus]